MDIESFAGKCTKLCSRIQLGTRLSFVHVFLVPVWLVAFCDIIMLQRCASLRGYILTFSFHIFHPRMKIYILKILFYLIRGHKGHECFLF